MSIRVGRLQWVSTVMLAGIPLLAATSVALVAVYWVGGVNVLGDQILVIADTTPVRGRQGIGLIAALPGLTARLAALAYLFRMFQGFRRGMLIDQRTVARLRGFSLFSGLAAFFDVAGSGARRWAQGEFDGPVWTHIQIASEQQAILFSSFVFYVVSFALAEANAYKEEAESYL